VGIPARVISQVTEKHKEEWQYYKEKYAELAGVRYPRGLKRIG
jgi:carbonic anhydrase/acetyltransferase-like protein (isoleucine patch superfamily)